MKNDYSDYHSQNDEDAWIVENLELPDNGIFIDVGAASAKFRNNTYHFEMNGWEGICIDADPHWFSKCNNGDDCVEHPCESLPEFRKNYLHAAISNKIKKVNFFSCNRHVLSSIVIDGTTKREHGTLYTMKTRTLNSVMKEYKYDHIDLLSIDAEKHDWEVWQSLDYKKYVPKVIICEFAGRAKTTDYRLREFLNECEDYTLAYSTRVNDIFIHSSIKRKG